MTATPPASPSTGGTFVRVLVTGWVVATTVGFPSIGVASTMSSNELGLLTVIKAVVSASLGAAIATLIVRHTARQIWTAWVGLLGGFVPASLVAPRGRWIGLALAHLAAGALLVLAGLRLAGLGEDAASDEWAFFGVTTALVGLGVGLGGALPRLWWARRGGGVEQPDDTVSHHLELFVWLSLAALSLSSGFAATLPAKLDPSGVPLRRGTWERGCLSTLASVQDICPQERRHVLRTRRAEPMRIEWSFPRGCEVAITADGERRVYAEPAGWQRLSVAPEHEVIVSMIALDHGGCHFRLRARPDPEAES